MACGKLKGKYWQRRGEANGCARHYLSRIYSIEVCAMAWSLRKAFIRKESLSKSDWLFFAIQVGAAMWIYQWWFHLPPPGYSVGVLAVLAAVMSVHGEMPPFQKVFWLLLIAAFLFLEFRAIDWDRANIDAHDALVRMEERSQFREVMHEDQEHFQELLRGDQSQFQSLLSSETKTQKFAETKANFGIQMITPLIQNVNPFFQDINFDWNVMFMNVGNEDATDVNMDAKMLLGQPRDADSVRLLKEFDQWWKQKKKHWHNDISQPGITGAFATFEGLRPTPQERQTLVDHSQTVYLIIRFEYSDHAGRWAYDVCEYYQDVMVSTDVTHPCRLPRKGRYRIQRSRI